MVREVWIAPSGHPGIAVVVGVVVVYRVFGASFKAEVNLGHLSEVFLAERRRRLTTAIPDVWAKAVKSLPVPGT